MTENRERRLFLPVRRRLTVLAIAALAGVHLSQYAACPVLLAVPVCAGLAVLLCMLLRTHRRALPAAALLLLLAFNAYAGQTLMRRDIAGYGKMEISGTVTKIVSENRVLLTDVRTERDKAPERPVMMTLMQDENDRVPMPEIGQRVAGTGKLFAQEGMRNPGGYDGYLNARLSGYELSGYILPGWTVAGEARFSLPECFRRLRMRLVSLLERVFGEDAPLFEGIMLGERGDLDETLLTGLRLSGVAHILTVSGMHIGILSMCLDWLLRRLPMGRKKRFLLHALLITFFAGLTNMAVGTVRALVMAYLSQIARLCGRRSDTLTSLSAAALLLMMVHPLLPLGAAFRFSFMAVAGLSLLAGGMKRRLLRKCPRCPRRLADALASSFCAMVAACPMNLMLYGYLPLLCLPMNVLCCWIIPVLMVGGWIAAGLGLVFLPLGRLVAAGLGVPAKGLEILCGFVVRMGGGVVRLPAPFAVTLALSLFAMALMSESIRFGSRKRIALAVSAVLIVLCYVPRFDPSVRYVQLSVGQGDGALLRKGRHACAVDVGPSGTNDVLRYLRYEGLTLDCVTLSHLDADHAAALFALLGSEVRVGGIVMAVDAEEDCSSWMVADALALAREKGVPIRFVQRGDVIGMVGYEFDVLSPDETLTGDNERSLVLYGDVEGTKLLLTGDLTDKAERDDFPDCDILKVAHHGSKYATTMEFLEAVTPEAALISVGAGNSYGHPTERVLSDLEEIGAKVYRTDRSGCLTVWLSREGWKVEPYRDGR